MDHSLPPEPALGKAPSAGGPAAAIAKGRWRWYYTMICDYRLAHPGCTNREIGDFMQKNENTIGAIVNSDLYKDYERKRLTVFRLQQEEQLRNKLTGVTMKALDAMEAQLDKRKDQTPLQLATNIVEMGLDRLGFAPASTPNVVVNNQLVNSPAVSPTVLQEARMALRIVEQNRITANMAGLGEPQDPQPAPKEEEQALQVEEPERAADQTNAADS